MEFLILGPLEVRDGERVIAVKRRRQRALLALLLLRAGEVVPADVLIEEIWAPKPPRAARAALHNNVSQLRRELGDEVIERRAPGYVLQIDPGQLDLVRFEQLVADARETDSAEKRAAQLGKALALWRGPALADLTYEPFADVEIRRLEELQLAARQDLVDAQLDLGRHAEVLGDLEALIAVNPFDERLRAQLMLALYRSARQADALAAYQDARRALLDGLGLEPGVALRELEQAILRQDPSLDLPAVLPSLDERRKTVTVLACEVAPTASGLDPEELRRLTVRALSSVRAAIDAHGGAVETRAGDELLGVFGVPASHEDDALRAVRAAAELRAEFGDVDLRFGIDTGEALTGHGFVSGEVVGRSKGLARTAAAGEILLGEATVGLCRNAVQVEAANGAHRLLAVKKGARPAARTLDAPLVGRTTELAALRDSYERASNAGRGHVVAVLGEPGIGKTRLARELVGGVGDKATVLVGRCVSYGAGATYLPLREMVAQAGGDLAEIVGDAGTLGEQLLHVRRFFERHARERPLVLVFDDVHWAEPALLDLVEQLDERTEGPILTLCLARPELREFRPALGEGAIELGPLGEQHLRALVDSLAQAVPEEVRTRVVDSAGGNPLFAEQLVAYAEEGGAVDVVPPSAEALIAVRLDLLEPGERSVLQRAAVVGRFFSRRAVEDLSPAHDLAVGEFLRHLAEKGLVHRRRGGFRFHHVLVRDVAYASLPKTERAGLHERLADWLDERGETDELVGYHLEQAYRLRTELGLLSGRARRLAADAGGRLGAAGIGAWKRGDAPAAVNLLGRASELLPERGSVRLELCCELGLALRTAGELSRAEEALVATVETAASAGDRRNELRAQLELAYLRLFSDPEGRADELLDVAAQALPVFEAIEDERSLGRAWLMLAFVHGLMHYRHGAAAEAAERALEHHRRCGWPISACLAFLAASAQNGPMPAKDGIALCRGLLAQADLGGEANVLPPLAELEAMRGRFAEARRLVARARAAYDQLGQHALAEANCGPVEGRIELLAGDTGAAARALSASCEALERMGGLSFLATRAAELGDALYGLGQYEEAERLSRRAEELAATDDVLTQILWRSLRARVSAQDGNIADADALSSEATRIAEETDALNCRATVHLDRAEVLRLSDRSDEAGAAVELAISLFEQKGNTVASRKARAMLLELTSA
jgi:DNA-binding SARP family transcriptional activator